MRMNFSTRSQTKVSPTKAITYPRHIFVDREAKKILKKQRALGTRFPSKVNILVQYNTSTKITTHPIYG